MLYPLATLLDVTRILSILNPDGRYASLEELLKPFLKGRTLFSFITFPYESSSILAYYNTQGESTPLPIAPRSARRTLLTSTCVWWRYPTHYALVEAMHQRQQHYMHRGYPSNIAATQTLFDLTETRSELLDRGLYVPHSSGRYSGVDKDWAERNPLFMGGFRNESFAVADDNAPSGEVFLSQNHYVTCPCCEEITTTNDTYLIYRVRQGRITGTENWCGDCYSDSSVFCSHTEENYASSDVTTGMSEHGELVVLDFNTFTYSSRVEGYVHNDDWSEELHDPDWSDDDDDDDDDDGDDEIVSVSLPSSRWAGVPAFFIAPKQEGGFELQETGAPKYKMGETPSTIPDYHRAERAIFIAPRAFADSASRTYGLELEVSFTDESARWLFFRDFFHRSGLSNCSRFSAELDSSTDRRRSLEIIGAPMALREYQQPRSPWEVMCEALYSYDAVGWKVRNSHGLHVNFDMRPVFKPALERSEQMDIAADMALALHNMRELTIKLAGRAKYYNASRMALDSKGRMKYMANKREMTSLLENNGKYNAVFPRPNSSLGEVRVFGANIRYTGLLRSIEYTDAVYNCFTGKGEGRQYLFGGLTLSFFRNWVLRPSNAKRWPTLAGYLSPKVTNENRSIKRDVA